MIWQLPGGNPCYASTMGTFESAWRDARQSLRVLSHEKSFSFTVLGIFALCLAANVAIFSVVHTILLKPLPFFEPEQLVISYNSYPKAGAERVGTSTVFYLERKQGIAAFSGVAAYQTRDVTVGDAGSPERVEAAIVTPSFFPVLGVNPALGRGFHEEEAETGKNQVVILSDRLWRARFAADPAVIGRTLRFDSREFTVIGVMPPGFQFLSQRAQLWTPLTFSDHARKPTSRHSNNMEMIARLRPGVTVVQAQAQVDALNEESLKTDPSAKLVTDAGFHTVLRDMRSDHVANLRPILLLLQAGALFLLLIGAVNLANLLLVRATGRIKEYSVRLALGASRSQLARALVAETSILALLGGLLGLGLGAAALRGIGTFAAGQLHLASVPGVSPLVALAAVGASLILGLVLAVPVVGHTLHGKLTVALSAESRGGTTTLQVHRLRHALIIAQIALAFVLLAGTGLLGASFMRVLAVTPGFRPENVLTGLISLPRAKYPSKDRPAFIDRLTEEVRALPGVTAAGAVSTLPFTGGGDNNAIAVDGREPVPGESIQAHYTSGVTGDYFQAMGVPLREGRFLTADDTKTGRKICVIDEDVARRYWPQGGAIGHRLVLGGPDPKADRLTIVGVVGSVKQKDLAETNAVGAIYLPYTEYNGSSFALVIRTVQSPEAIAPALRATVLRLDPELPLSELMTMQGRVSDSLAGRRVPVLLAALFAAVALLLAAVGIYGVLAYSVLQRQREIGVRMALGAQPAQILRQFLGLGCRLLAIGLPLGLLGAWLAGRAMSGLLFGVTPADPAVLGGTTLLLVVVAMLACLLPSQRAARTAPIEALRGK